MATATMKKKETIKVKDLPKIIEDKKAEPQLEGVTEDGIKWTVFHMEKTPNFDKLFDIYAINKGHAKVYFENNRTDGYRRTRTLLFENPNGDFSIVTFHKKIGISKTNIMYSRESVGIALRYKAGKFYFTTGAGTGIKPLIYINLECFPKIVKEKTEAFLLERFPWVRNVSESSHMVHVSFNTIVSNKLFNEKKFLRYKYKTNYDNAVKIIKYLNFHPSHGFKNWGEIKDYVSHIEKFNMELVNNTLLIDSIKMAKMLKRVVNLSWSKNRLKSEHDKWAKEIVNVLLQYESYQKLNIHPLYEDFAEFSGYEMLESNFDLIDEGKMMGHCVGTYSNSVNSGSCAIFRVFGYTLELGSNIKWSKDNIRLFMNQYQGFGNSTPPLECTAKVKDMIERFNKEVITPEYLKEIETRAELKNISKDDTSELDGLLYADGLPF